MAAAPSDCPCGRSNAKGQPLPYTDCCAPLIDQGLPAPDAERLMRSRYSAFVLERADHLLATWHASTRPAALTLEPDVKWLGLTVKSHQVIDPDRAEVAFVARSRIGGKGHRLEERSRFVRERGCWFYVDGDVKA